MASIKKVAALFMTAWLLLCVGCQDNQSSASANASTDTDISVTQSNPSVSASELDSVGETKDNPVAGNVEPNAKLSAKAKVETVELPLEGHIIGIDPGHCVTPETGKGHRELVSPLSTETKPLYTTGTHGANLTEEKLNLLVGMKIRDALESLGAQVVMTREVSEITLGGIERCTIPDESGCEVCIRIHADGFSDSSVHGVSVLVPSGDLLRTPSIVDESARLGQLMVDAVADETGAKNRGISPRSDMTGFNFSEIPTVLIELGFMTNPEEDALLETDEYQGKLVSGIVKSLMEWYKAKI